MFERFTDEARESVVLAQEEARSLRHGCIGTEHLLLGVAGQPAGIAARVLAQLGLDASTIRNDIVAQVGEGGDFDHQDEDALRALGIDLDDVRRAVEDSFGPGALERPIAPAGRGLCDTPWVGGSIPFSPRAKKSLQLALRWTRVTRRGRIGAEHVLLGLAAERDGLGARILRSHGIDATRLRAAIEDDVAPGGAAP